MRYFGYPKTLLVALVAALALLVPATAGAVEKSGGTSYEAPPKKARVVNGKAVAPRNAPAKVKKIIAAANRIVRKPYRYGGGHGSWDDSGYDCSGTVSYALHGAGLLSSALDSSGFMRWGKSGRGKWVTIYANGGHAFMVIAGLRLDTGYRTSYAAKWGGKGGSGPRWDKRRSTDGFHVRHPSGL